MKRSKLTGIIGTLAVHVLVVVLLVLLRLAVPEKQEEGGVPVMMGNTDLAQGSSDPYTMTEVDVVSEPQPETPSVPEPQPEVKQPMITQQDEPSLKVKEEKPKSIDAFHATFALKHWSAIISFHIIRKEKHAFVLPPVRRKILSNFMLMCSLTVRQPSV